MITLESEEWFDLQRIFLLISDKAKALPIRACLHGGGGPQEGAISRKVVGKNVHATIPKGIVYYKAMKQPIQTFQTKISL